MGAFCILVIAVLLVLASIYVLNKNRINMDLESTTIRY